LGSHGGVFVAVVGPQKEDQYMEVVSANEGAVVFTLSHLIVSDREKAGLELHGRSILVSVVVNLGVISLTG